MALPDLWYCPLSSLLLLHSPSSPLAPFSSTTSCTHLPSHLLFARLLSCICLGILSSLLLCSALTPLFNLFPSPLVSPCVSTSLYPCSNSSLLFFLSHLPAPFCYLYLPSFFLIFPPMPFCIFISSFITLSSPL